MAKKLTLLPEKCVLLFSVIENEILISKCKMYIGI